MWKERKKETLFIPHNYNYNKKQRKQHILIT